MASPTAPSTTSTLSSGLQPHPLRSVLHLQVPHSRPRASSSPSVSSCPSSFSSLPTPPQPPPASPWLPAQQRRKLDSVAAHTCALIMIEKTIWHGVKSVDSGFRLPSCESFIFFFKGFFGCRLFFKVFIEFVMMLLPFYVLVFWPQGMWDLRSPTRDQMYTLCIGRRSLSH